MNKDVWIIKEDPHLMNEDARIINEDAYFMNEDGWLISEVNLFSVDHNHFCLAYECIRSQSMRIPPKNYIQATYKI